VTQIDDKCYLSAVNLTPLRVENLDCPGSCRWRYKEET